MLAHEGFMVSVLFECKYTVLIIALASIIMFGIFDDGCC